MVLSRLLWARPHFKANPLHLRSEKIGLGCELVSAEHEMVQAQMCMRGNWAFQHKGDRFDLSLASVLDDGLIKCATGSVHVDLVAMISPTSKHYGPFRGRLLILIKGDQDEFDRRNKKRIALLSAAGHYVVEMPIVKRLGESANDFTPARLGWAMGQAKEFVESEPEVDFIYRPGWVQGDRVITGTVHNDEFRTPVKKLDLARAARAAKGKGLLHGVPSKITALVASVKEKWPRAAKGDKKPAPKFRLPLE